ncbi:MAG: amidohydrolase [Chitinophagales bacterium]
MNPLRITLIQSNLQWENIEANLQMFSQKIAAHKETCDVLVLPEMFSTGFSMRAKELAETMEGSAVQWMKQTAAENNCVVTGSLIIEEAGEYHNRLVWMRPDGSFETYDKRHLFSLSGEDKVYTEGKDDLIVTVNGWHIKPLICYDLRFPVWSRNKNGAYDALIYVANWPERRVQAWKYLLIARAIENQAYCIGLNRAGNDGNDIYYSGDSMVVDAVGNVLFHEQHNEVITTITLNHEELIKTRNTFRFLEDGDDFVINPRRKIVGH